MTHTPQRPTLTDIARQCWATMTPKEICARYGCNRHSLSNAARALGLHHNAATQERIHEQQQQQGHTVGSDMTIAARRRRTLRRRYRETREAAWQGKPAPTRLPCTTVPHHVRVATSKLCARYGYVRTADPYTLARTATTHRIRCEALHTRRHHLTFVDL